MRGLMVLCLVAAATALPQGYNYGGPSGYNYNRPGGAISGSSSHGIGSIGGGGGGIGGIGGGGAQGGNQVTKNFYIHTAAEDNDADADDSVSSSSGRENYNILFVKAPAQSSASLAASLAKLQQKDKTVVYVLNKKTDASELQNALDQVKSQPSKPEVFFIKYKTPEEAVHAQHQIQSQYDALGGTSNVSDEGVSPVSSVIGSVGPSGSGHGIGSGPSNTYLPPSY